MTTPYTTGTITLTANSTAITGNGTGWLTALIAGGTIYPAAPGGNALPILSVNSDTGITAAVPWRGASGTYSYALMRDTAYGQQAVANAQALAEYLARLDNKTIAAMAALAASMAADRFAYASGPNTMAWSTVTPYARSLLDDANAAAVYATLGEIPNARLPARLQENAPIVTDANDATTSGVHRMAAGATNSPEPEGAVVLYVGSYAAGFTAQIGIRTANGNAYTRTQATTGTWTSWKRVANGATDIGLSLVTAASQAAARSAIGALSTGGGSILGASANNISPLLIIRDNSTTPADTPSSVLALRKQNSTSSAIILGNDGNGHGTIGGGTASSLRFGNWSGETFSEFVRLHASGGYLAGGSLAAAPTTIAGSGWSLGNSSEAGVFRLSRSGGVIGVFNREEAGELISIRNTNSAVGGISITGSATSFNTSSDYRLKASVSPLVQFSLTADQFDALDDTLLRVMSWRPVSYLWINDPDAGLTHGFIAHELDSVSPHAVTGEKDGTEDIGTATIPERVIAEARTVEVRDEETGEVVSTYEEPAEIAPEQVLENILEADAPEESTWTRTGERPVYQGVDHSKLVPDLAAALQSATLMILEQREMILALQNRVSALEDSQL